MFCRCYLLLVCCLLTVISSAQHLDSTAHSSTEIIFVSDTQAPLWFEKLYTKTNHNQLATQRIFASILLRNPAAVYLLGDVVALGASNKQWKPIDGYLQTMRNRHIQFNAALGNHELLCRPMKGQSMFQERFPQHCKTGSLNITDSVAVILLNSNFKFLTAYEDSLQVNWYQHTLQKLDNDPAIKCIITGCHHSPYTNSRVVKSSMGVRQKFVPYFIQSKKSLLFLSGHSHNFEHFKQQGKDFFVIGGGGGLHQPLRKGKHLLPDLSANYKPCFHYASLHRNRNQLLLTSVMLTADFSRFEENVKFVLTPTE